MSYRLNNVKASPLKGVDSLTVTSSFGARSFYNSKTKKQQNDFHSGIDLVGGVKIIATGKGKVAACQNNIKGYDSVFSRGNYIIIDHGNGIETAYYHIKYGTMKVKVGDIVDVSCELGDVGATGNATGVHLHYGVRVNGKWVDPSDYLLGKKIFAQNSESEDKYLEYKIKKGDTLSGIALKFNTSVNELVRLNNIKDPNVIMAGTTILVAGSSYTTYTVKPGDNLSVIARKYNTTWESIYELNKSVIGNNANLIHPGDVLKIEVR